jgi:hypothetical protein
VVSKQLAKLSSMMRDTDFRVRTQAAFSLGRMGDSSALAPLIKGLGDAHPAVRAAAAVSIGRLGDPTALPTLRQHQDNSDAVKRQVTRSISILEASNNQIASKTASGGPDPLPIDWTRAHHYLELSHIANVSKTKRPGLDETIKSLAWRELRRLDGYVISDGQDRPSGLNAELRRRRLQGYMIAVSLGRLARFMAPNKVQIRAEVMLSIFTFPEQNYQMSVNGEASITLVRNAFRENQIPMLQEDALSGAIQAAFRELDQNLESKAPRRRRASTKAGSP